MTATPDSEHVGTLRSRHPLVRYQSYKVTPVREGLKLDYEFVLAPELTFNPSITIPAPSSTADEITHRLAFLIGMVELLSYWKAACCPSIEVAAGHLSDYEINFWESVLRRGMGEYFYQNRISPSIEVSITNRHEVPVASRPQKKPPSTPNDSCMVLVGGGKDSTVTLELIKNVFSNGETPPSSFAVNPIPASLHSIQTAGYPTPLIAVRTIDPKLFALNQAGYLNGHTPFSALLAFVSTLVAYLHGTSYVLASNEASASEANVSFEGVEINHQYSKSLDFERRFREYMRISSVPVQYVSFLRPVNELQICALFSSLKDHHLVFRSCNREQTLRARQQAYGASSDPHKIRGWCTECPKCIFTYLCLSCFLPQTTLVDIFGRSPQESINFLPTARELAGFSEHKPFECVGTFEEVRACLRHLFSSGVLMTRASSDMAQLHEELRNSQGASVRELLTHWNNDHFLPDELERPLKASLATAMEGLIR